MYNHVDSLIIASEAENDVRPIMEGVTDTLPVSKVHDVFCKATSDSDTHNRAIHSSWNKGYV